MQAVLNVKERNEAFFIFSIFFLLTIVLVTIAIYFNFSVPVKQSEYLKQTVFQQQSGNRAEENFAIQVYSKKKEIDSSSKTEGALTPDVLSLDKLNSRLEEQNILKPSIVNMNHVIVNALSELISAKNKIKELEKRAMKVDELQEKLEKSQLSLDAYRQHDQNVNIKQ